MKKSSFNLGKVLNKKQQTEIHGGSEPYSENTIGNISSLFSNVLYTPRSVSLDEEEQ